ncbi:MAG: hypothetical protein ACOCXT_04505 [Candidatus Dojkabacteria bacterium]
MNITNAEAFESNIEESGMNTNYNPKQLPPDFDFETKAILRKTAETRSA